jgi:hypothetical protein
MRRRLIQLGLFILAGAIVNVAVAWGCLRIPMAKQERALEPSEIRDLMTVQTTVDWNDHDHITAIEKRQFGVAWVEMYEGEPFLVLSWAGWPLLSLRDEQALGPLYPKRWVVWASRRHRSIVIPDSVPDGFKPHRPVWPGFTINTLLYATILWLMFAAPFALRRRRRIKRGLCSACGYDLRGRASNANLCPECGASA